MTLIHTRNNMFFLSLWQSPEKAKEYFMRKVEFITKQMEKIQPMLQEKCRTKQGDPSGFGFRIPLFHFCL